ncbi:MAG: hypothetical protein DRJ64_07470 [Thermoprotei archaeon]|nr:MAG: hypothetical protein DRJ64_07470 [Thermoprotei archaeon]
MEKKDDRLEKEQDLPIDPRLVIQTSRGTVRYLIDAIVELVTNSDDSYRRLEQEGVSTEGEITIRVRRLKYGKCEKLEVIDFAEGMTKEQLKQALKFAGETSGFEKGRSVRGFFGRGLKEAILALGRGEIYTIKNGELSRAVLWREGNKPKYRPPKKSYIPNEEERREIGIVGKDGTAVKIDITNEKIKCPSYKTLLSQIAKHFALRDINSAVNRKVTLIFESPEKHGLIHKSFVSYQPPEGKKVIEQSMRLPRYGDRIEIKIYESEEELESPYNNPFARAGLLIKTSGTIVDNQLFKYQNERAGRFFFGEVNWLDLAERLRKGEPLLDLNRVGIEWQHEICQVLQEEIEKILEPLVKKKEKQIKTKLTPLSKKMEKLNKNVCSLLNRLAKKHIAELPPGEELPNGEMEINGLTIKPSYANVEIDRERYFSVYAPAIILNSHQVEVTSSNSHIQVLDQTVELIPHPKYPNIHYGRFRIAGKMNGEEGTIICKLDDHSAVAKVKVAELGKIGKRRGPKGGFFHSIRPAMEENPSQRARYDESNRTVWIYIKFPGVERYFGNDLSFKGEESKPMYAELVGEAFCKFIARYDVEHGKFPIMGDPINAFAIAMDEAQKRYLHLIHEAVFKHRL